MNNTITITFEDLFGLVLGLIEDDLKIQKHFHNLSLSGLDTSMLHLNLHRRIFILAGFREEFISEELEYWYFEQMQCVAAVDLLKDEHVLRELATGILEGLLKARYTLYVEK